MAGKDERPWLRACLHVDCPIERCIWPQLSVTYRGFEMFRCDACGEDYMSIESARGCRDSHTDTRGRVGSISGGTPLAAPQGDAGSSPAASTVVTPEHWRSIDIFREAKT